MVAYKKDKIKIFGSINLKGSHSCGKHRFQTIDLKALTSPLTPLRPVDVIIIKKN